MPIPEVISSRFLKDGQQVVIRSFPIGQAREHADGPGPAPARTRTATREPELKRFLNRVPHGGVVVEIDLVSRIGADNVRNVTMVGLGLGERKPPFLQAPVFADTRALNLWHRLSNRLYKRIVQLAQRLCGLQIVAEDLENHELIKGIPRRKCCKGCSSVFPGIRELVFRRGAGARDKFARRRIRYEPRLGESGRRGEYVPVFLQECLVVVEAVVLQDVEGHPLPAEKGTAPIGSGTHDSSVSPGIGRMPHAPAFHAEALRHALAGRLEVANEIEKRLMHLAKVRGLRRPVIHLNIDVQMKIRTPRCFLMRVPDSLQVRRQGSRAG